jgi:predicted dehydrogenase
MKRILLVGLGRWGTNHLRILKSMPVELFVSDVDTARLKASGIDSDHCSSDARSLFSRIDAAVVVTPAQTHFDLCRELLAVGKDVFVEKPITLQAEEAEKLNDLAQKKELVLQVGHIFRFDPASIWLRDAVTEGRFGRIKFMRATFSGFKRPRLDTGVTFADAIHFIDLFNFLLGTVPSRIHAVLNDFFGRGMDDQSLISLEYPQADGPRIFATIETGYHVPGKFREVVIAGTNASAVCDYNVAQYKIKTFENRHTVENGEIKAAEGAVHQLEFPPEEPLRVELAAFVDSIQSRATPVVSGRAGYDAVRVIASAFESARTGNWIPINQ